MSQINCAWCGIEFSKHARYVREKNYCSKSCRGKSNKGKTYKSKGVPSPARSEAAKKSHASGLRKPTRHSWARGGIREDLGHYVRSSWEANYARILLSEGIEYIYEPPGMACDFYLLELNEVVEIKPDHRFHELPKFFELEERGFKCRVIGSQEYRELVKIGEALEYWE